jgi:hypothetical protein
MSPPPLSVEKLFSSSTSRDSFPFLFYFFLNHTHKFKMAAGHVTRLEYNLFDVQQNNNIKIRLCVVVVVPFVVFPFTTKKKREREKNEIIFLFHLSRFDPR